MSAEPQPPPPAEPRWWLRILLAVFALGVVVIVGIAVAAYRFSQRPEVKEKMGAIGDLVKMAAAAANAPGAAELRALGCRQAVIMDGAQLTAINDRVGRLAGDADAGEGPYDTAMVSVWCTPARGHQLSCPGLARTYGAAVPSAKEPFYVVLQDPRGQEAECQGFYDRQGNLQEGAPAAAEAPGPGSEAAEPEEPEGEGRNDDEGR